MLQIGSDLILIVGVRNFILAKMCRHYLALSQRPALDKTKMIKTSGEESHSYYINYGLVDKIEATDQIR